MKYLELTERLKELDKMINAGQATCPMVVGRRFAITSRSAISLINLLKSLGAPVYYCRRTKAYRMAVKGSLVIKWIPDSSEKNV